MLNKKALAASVSAPPDIYPEDVFQTYLYTGNGSTQTITNGIDLSGKGGMVWIKSRSGATWHALTDTVRGTTKSIASNSTNLEQTESTGLTAFSSTGFTIDSDADYNTNAATYCSWTFREQEKFFDVVTYTGNGVNRTIAHNLGSVPGMILVKRTDTTANWNVYHRSLGNTKVLYLNLTDTAQTISTCWNNTSPTSSQFTVGTDTDVNANGGTYVAYLFAHDDGGFGDAGTDNIISCGTYTGNGSATGPTVTLNYEPQWLLIKRTDTAAGWNLIDNMRGFVVGGTDAELNPNLTDAESTGTFVTPTATGFQLNTTDAGYNANNGTYIYMAIRRSMKVPTSGTQVFSPTVYTGTNADNRLVNTGILTDMVMLKERNDTVAGMVIGDRLRGQPYLLTGSTEAEVNDADSLDQQIVSTTEYGTAFSSHNGVYVGNDATSKVNIDTTSNNHIAWAFKRARKFFDVVCYTGTGVFGRTIAHNLGVVPELIIVKNRSNDASWGVYNTALQNGFNILLSDASGAAQFEIFGANANQTSTQFTLGENNLSVHNASNQTYVAYLFASVNGVSKVGSYTGNGSNQTINCGFTAGARFVLIKRTDSTGDWYVYDTARGIVSGNDPQLKLNTTDAEATGYDAIDPDNSGFIVNNDATNFPINVNNATYIYLAIA